MIDFLMIATRTGKRGTIEIYPKFIIKKSKDLMIRGSDFYAVWMEERGLWSTDEQDALQMIDRALDIYAEEHKQVFNDSYRVLRSRRKAMRQNGFRIFWRRGTSAPTTS